MKIFQDMKLMAVIGLGAALLVPVYAASKSSKTSAKNMVLTGRRLINYIGEKSNKPISKTEFNKHKKSFKKVDLNGDGYATYEEYVEDGKYYTKQQRYEFFLGADRNWDSVMTESEFVENLVIVTEGVKVFKEFDYDEDWKVSIDEFIRKIRRKTRSTTLISRIFKKLDTNVDEEISYQEFIVKWGYWSR